ncbi:hypothetical protein QL285_090812 [Trifolium repens]|nr:hypothetical protein QL285_090812 [Trifolium repens]
MKSSDISKSSGFIYSAVVSQSNSTQQQWILCWNHMSILLCGWTYECGVCTIYYSESQTVLSTANLDKDLKLELYEEIQKEAIRYEARLVKYCDEKDNTFMQEWEWNENYQPSYDSLIVSNDNQVYENPLEKENSDDDDDNSNKLMKSKILHESSTKSGEEIETSSHKQEQFKKEEDSTGECSDVD